MAKPIWIHLTDPDNAELQDYLPRDLHEIASQRLHRTREFDEDIFARLESHDSYLFGEFADPTYDPNKDTIHSISIRVIIDFHQFLTVIRTPTGLPNNIDVPDLGDVQTDASLPNIGSGDCIWLLTSNIAKKIHKLLDMASDRTELLDELLSDEDRSDLSSTECRQEIASLRSIYLQLEMIAEPTLGLVEKIIDDELDLKEIVDGNTQELFPRYTEIRLIDVQELLKHAQQRCNRGQEMMRSLVDNLSSYLDREQTKAGNRLTSIASIMLLPTFVVGLYGMNIDEGYFPEFGWLNGYLLAWIVISLLTLIQILLFKKIGWLFKRK